MKKGIHPACALLVFTSILLVSANRRAKSVVDPRVMTVNAFFKCLKGPTCSTTKVLRGRKAFDAWKRLVRERPRRGIVVKSTALVRNVPARFKVRWKTRWFKAVAELKTAGFSAPRLKKLGLGKAIVRANSKVSVAFVSVTYEKRGRLKTGYLVLVLWRVKRRWYVAFWEDSPRTFTLFMKKNKPR
jgi:hypothetical protein